LKSPSAFATARLRVILRRLEPLAGDIAKVDVHSLGSSKGGKGTALPAQLSTRVFVDSSPVPP
jgi:hypothetical protein